MSAVALPFVAGAPLPGPHATWARRRAALGELTTVGWPTRRRERWRYTDLEPLAAAGFDLTPPPPGPAELRAAAERVSELGLGSTARQLVFIDGHRAPELSATTIEGLEIGDVEGGWSTFEARYASGIATADHPLASLNTAFVQRGLWLHATPGTNVAEPLHLVFIGSARTGLAPQPRIVIEIARGARLTLVQHFVDLGGGTGWTNSVIQVRQEADSRLELLRLQRHAEQRAHTSLLAAELDANAELTVGYVDIGGALVRNDVDVKLKERGARAELFGLFLAGAGQHVDDHLRIDHAAPETRSDETFRGIIAARGHGVFNGKVLVRAGAQRIDARQSNDNLLLGEHAEIDTKPELEIYADDVKCSHGSTVGELDAEQLFYLRTRGIAAAAARELLTAAFAASVLERVRDEQLRAQFLDAVTQRLRSFAERPA